MTDCVLEGVGPRKEDIDGLTLASDERIRVYLVDSRVGAGTIRVRAVHPPEVPRGCLEALSDSGPLHLLYAATARSE